MISIIINYRERMQEIGEVKISSSVKIVINRVKFRKQNFIDIRKWVKTKRYTGLTRKGIMIPEDVWLDFMEVLRKVKVKP